jgi:Glycosyl hydrolase family 3 N terminal domain
MRATQFASCAGSNSPRWCISSPGCATSAASSSRGAAPTRCRIVCPTRRDTPRRQVSSSRGYDCDLACGSRRSGARGRTPGCRPRGWPAPLLIAVDQEGGVVKRLPGPPTAAPSEMKSAGAARAQGLATSRYLRGLDINADLAPVLDVPTGPSAFIFSRAFSTSPSVVATRGVSFAQGVLAGGAVAAGKHFPGLGRLTKSTDSASVTVLASRAALARDLIPFKRAIAAGIPAIMVGTAIYPAYGDHVPAAYSPSIVVKLLRGALHFRGVTLSDDLDTAAVWSHISPRRPQSRRSRWESIWSMSQASTGAAATRSARRRTRRSCARHRMDVFPARLSRRRTCGSLR